MSLGRTTLLPGRTTPAPATPHSATPSPDEVVRSLVATHELERQRIARDLHDVVGQALTAIRLHLEHIRTDPAGHESIRLEAEEAIAEVDSSLREVRDLAFEIRPAIIDDLGLVAAARWFVARQARISGFDVEFHADVVEMEFGLAIEAACFRTIQEALTNITRHAAASTVRVVLTATASELLLEVSDDGVGFNVTRLIRSDRPRAGSIGLLGTWERIALVGGRLAIDSRPGLGTSIRATFPRPPGPDGEETP